MSEVKAIGFGFENCESVEIPVEYVYTFNVSGITKSRGYYPHGQGLHEYTVANKLYVSFQKSFSEWEEKTIFGTLVKERLEKYNDICWFDIIYEDGSKENYMVSWKGEDQYNNSAQKTTHEEWGLLVEVGYE